MPAGWTKDRGAIVNEKGEAIRKRWELVRPHLDERARRCWAGAEALAQGRGGVTLVAEATGLSRGVVAAGAREVENPPAAEREKVATLPRVRRRGGGRKSWKQTMPGLLEALEKLLDSSTRGDPQSPLRWTSKSLHRLAEELRKQGFSVSANIVSEALRKLKYSLQANRKTREGASHPDRNAQFEHIAATSAEFLANGEPVISVDGKKKELIGPFENGGREYRPVGDPERVSVHDFEIPELGKVTPYGVYDRGRNLGWVSVGTDHDTAAFAVATIARWWTTMGAPACPNARRLLITADAGGSNGYRLRAWKTELQKLADETGLDLTVCHFPPGTSKWNHIEHRMFSHITMNWRGKPLVSHEVIVNLISKTTTTKGLRINAELDRRSYPKGIKISDNEMSTLRIERHLFHGEWNYTIRPRGPTLASGP